jgi:hypothetical protein
VLIYFVITQYLEEGTFIHQWLYNTLLGTGCFFTFVILYTVGRTP